MLLQGRVTRYPISISRMIVSILSSPTSISHNPISHIDIQDDHIDMVDDHIDNPYPISISHIPYRYPYRYLIDIRYPISISHIDIRSYNMLSLYPWDHSTTRAAAEHGHLEVLRWAREHGCPWNEDTCYYAARNGHLAVLQWARAHGCESISRRTVNLLPGMGAVRVAPLRLSGGDTPSPPFSLTSPNRHCQRRLSAATPHQLR